MIGKKKKKGKINLIQKRRNMLRSMGKAPARQKQKVYQLENDPFVPAAVPIENYDEEEALKDFMDEMEQDAKKEEIEAQEFLEAPVEEDTLNIFNFKFDEDIIPQKKVEKESPAVITPKVSRKEKAQKPKDALKANPFEEITFDEFTESKDTAGFDLDQMAKELLQESEEMSFEEFQDPTLDEDGVYIGPKTVVKGNHLLELEKGNYVVLGVFRTYRTSEEYSDNLFIKGIRTKFGYISQTKTYYVYVFVSDIYSEAMTVSNQHKKLKIKFKENWILRVQ
jgi:hypothetical protein